MPIEFSEPADLNEVAAVECMLEAENGRCSTFPDGRDQAWVLQHLYVVNPTVEAWWDTGSISKTEPVIACTADTEKDVIATFEEGHGLQLESFGFLPEAEGTKNTSGHFSPAQGLLGNVSWDLAHHGSWTIEQKWTVSAAKGTRAWLEVAPGFRKLTGQMVLQVGYTWGGSGSTHHRAYLVNGLEVVRPYLVTLNGVEFHAGSATARSEPLTDAERVASCG